MKFFLKASLLLLIVSVASLFAYFLNELYSKSYLEFVSWVAYDLFKKPHLVKFIPKYFNENKFDILRISFTSLSVVFLVIVAFVIRKWSPINKNLLASSFFIGNVFKEFIRSIWPKEKFERTIFFIIILMPFLIACYNIYTIPVSYDEAVSYIDFISKGPIVISTLFHTTNNHILYNFLAYLSCLILPNGEVAQRLPLLPIYLFNCFLLFGLLKKLMKPYPALISLSFFVLSTPIYLYSFMSRGYMLVIFFVLLILFAARQLLLTTGKRYWVTLFVSSVFGMYSVPVMAYFLAAVYFFLSILFLIYDRKKILPLVKTGALSLLAICFFYLPVFLVSGIGSVVQVVKEISTNLSPIEVAYNNIDLLTDFYLSSNIFIKLILGAPVLAGLIYAAVFVKGQNKLVFLLFTFLSVVPLLTTLVLGQRMFDRTWIYLIVPVSAFYSLAFSKINKKGAVIILVTGTVIIQYFSSSNNSYYSQQEHQIFSARKAADLFVEKKMSSIYIDHLYVRPMIEYRLSVLNYEYDLNIGSSVFRKSHFDTTKRYDMVVCTSHSKLPAFQHNYIMIDSVQELRVFAALSKK